MTSYTTTRLRTLGHATLQIIPDMHDISSLLTYMFTYEQPKYIVKNIGLLGLLFQKNVFLEPEEKEEISIFIVIMLILSKAYSIYENIQSSSPTEKEKDLRELVNNNSKRLDFLEKMQKYQMEFNSYLLYINNILTKHDINPNQPYTTIKRHLNGKINIPHDIKKQINTIYDLMTRESIKNISKGGRKSHKSRKSRKSRKSHKSRKPR
tara:strand:- start:27373 stop:27996 length:624 start_codon:yes stop_codon:yes gene_type:complete